MRINSGVSLRSSLWERPSLELACSRFVDATGFRFDSELDEGVGRDDLGLESEGLFGESEDMDPLPDVGAVFDD